MSRNPRRIAAQRSARLGGQELELGSAVLEQLADEGRRAYLRRRLELAPLPPPAERSSTTEAAWQRQVLELARRLGWWAYHPHLSLHSERGWPDLSMLHERRGRALFVELKTDRGHLSERQVEVVERMRACGLEVHVWRPWHTLELVAEELQR
jgi:hypothetical protein